MKLQHFFYKESIDNLKELFIDDEKILHQWRKVFRFEAGDRVVILDGSGYEFVCEIVSINKEVAKLFVVEKRDGQVNPPVFVSLYTAIVKNKAKFEWVLEKCTEIGVSCFCPIITQRGVDKNIQKERCISIIKESSEQCGRSKMPILKDLKELKDALSEDDDSFRITFHAGDDCENINVFKEKNMDLLRGKKISIFIGPEGGWSDSEIELFKDFAVPILSLGKSVLRSETASIVASALFII